MVRATLIGDEALAAKFNAAAAKVVAEKPTWLRDVGELVELSIQESIIEQGLEDTGALFYSGRVFYQTANGISIGFGKGLEYAEPLELGAAAHEITGNPLLAFMWEGAKSGGYGNAHSSQGSAAGNAGVPGGELFIGPSVQHPGNIAYRYVYNGTYRALVPILGYFFKELRAIFGGM